MPIPAAAAVTYLICFRRVDIVMIIYPVDYCVSIPFNFSLLLRSSTDFYGSTAQLLYFVLVSVFGEVSLDAAADYFCKIWDF